MSSIRKAYSVEIIDRRLRTCETGDCTVMELVGLHDELSRVERKWKEKADQIAAGRVSTRPLADAGQINQRFERLTHLVNAALRTPIAHEAEKQLLQKVVAELQTRTPLPTLK